MEKDSDNRLGCILLVEDDELSATYLTDLLAKMDIARVIRRVQDGAEALDYIQKARDGEDGFCDPNIIFLDLHMPNINGFEFLKRYEGESFGQSETYIVATMASLEADELKEVAEYRRMVETFVEKPITESIIKEVVTKYRLEHGLPAAANRH